MIVLDQQQLQMFILYLFSKHGLHVFPPSCGWVAVAAVERPSSEWKLELFEIKY